MGGHEDSRLFPRLRERERFNIFGQFIPPLQMLEVKICTSSAKYCEYTIDNIKRDLLLGISCSVLRGNGT